MADATNRKLDVENTDEDRISRDDPLFELSQIIGYSERKGAADADFHADEGQMDLEDALLRELEDFSGVIEENLPETAVEYEAAVENEAPADVTDDGAIPDESALPESRAAFEPVAPEVSEHVEDDVPDTLEAELIDLLGGLGDKAGAEWSDETYAAEEDSLPPDTDSSLAEPDEEMSPKVPAAAPIWYDQDAQEEPPHAEPARNDDSEILDAFESALSEGLALSFDEEANETAQPPADEPPTADELEQSFEFSLDLEESQEESAEYETETNYANDHVESTYLNEVEAAAEEIAVQAATQMPPVLDTAEMPASDMEAMQPLDLPDLPEVEDKVSAAVDIERELDAALSGYDNYDTGREDSESDMRAAATAAAADTRLDFDMGAFEDDLSRDLEYVSHDMDSRDGDAEYGDTDEGRDREAVAGAGVRKPKRGMMIAAAVGGIAILGAIGAFGLTSRDGGETGVPVLVKADPEPAKIVPEDPGGKEVPNQDRAVYGEVDGNGEAAPTQETLVSTSEEPIDLGGAEAPVLPGSMTEGVKVEDRLEPDVAETTAPAASDNGTAVLAPRRVRTVIVKPDGTLVESAPEPQAPAVATAPAPAQAETGTATEEPVRRIDMATNAPQASRTPSDSAATAPASDASPVVEQPEPEAATAEQLAAIAEPQAGERAAEETQQTEIVRQPLRAPTSIPERPADQPVTIVGSDQPAPRQVAEAPPQVQTPTSSQTVAQPQAVPAGAYTVQIASQPSAELAQKSAADLERRYANLIGNRTVAIQQADIEGRGTYHRVRIVANNRQDAVALCDRIKQEGGSCFVAR
jgi:hypothetical protein